MILIDYYQTHDNGARPFKIVITNSSDLIGKGVCSVDVYKHNEIYSVKEEEEYEESPLIHIENPFKIFIGKSPKNRMTEWSGAHGKKYDGNSILLKIANKEYMYIGESIFTFTSYHEITHYVSPVGNNDVVYPFCVDTEGNYYLLIEDVVCPFGAEENPYDKYYAEGLITENMGTIPPIQPVIKNFQGITEFYINNEPYTLRYTPNPEEDYDQSYDLFYVVKTDGIKYELLKKDYIKLMKDFGKEMGYRPLKDKTVVQKRF